MAHPVQACALAAITAGLIAAGPATAASAPGPLGAAIAKRDCAQCHAIGPSDYSANSAAPPFGRFDRKFVLHELDEDALATLMAHHAGMPQFHLTRQELRGLVAYMRALQTGKRASDGPHRSRSSAP